MFQTRVMALIEELADRLPREHLESVRTTARCGEEGCALNELLALIVKRGITITPAQGQEIRACITGMAMDAEILDMLLSIMEDAPVLKYLVVINGEGGATYAECRTPEEALSHANLRARTDAKLAELKAMRLGDEVTLDGCSDCYALRP